MTRRALTLLLAAALALVLAIGGAVQTVPYVVLSPGPSFDTLGTVGKTPVLTITGRKTYPTDGTLSLTTVSVLDDVTLAQALVAWFDGSEAVVPRELLYPPDQDRKETETENTQQMQQSHDDATAAALRAVGLPVTTRVSIGEIVAGQPAEGRLVVGDVLVTVGGKPVADVQRLRTLLNEQPPGSRVDVVVLRKGVRRTVHLTTVAAADDPRRAVIGVSARETSSFPVKVDIQLKDVGGPSAGLMFALGIVDKLQPGSLTGGRKVAGTGEITSDGTIVAIGGISQKMRGAQEAGASVFLVPDKNCEEARRTRPDGLLLLRVKTLKGAIAALGQVSSGGSAPTC